MLDPICEPVILDHGHQVLADLARVADSEDYLDVFFHFHDVAELLLFGDSDIDGDLHIENQRFPLQPRSVVYVPSMQPHGFTIRHGRRNRLLVQFEPALIKSLGDSTTITALNRVICCRPPDHVMQQMETLGLWLLDGLQQDPMAPGNLDMLRLMLRKVVRSSSEGVMIAPEASEGALRNHHRLDALLRQLMAEPGRNLSLNEAAELCCLSPAYFSRAFKKAFGMTYSNYRRSQKLRIAARRLCRSTRQVAQIGYELGFASPSHFVAAFKAEFGLTPEQYRQRYSEWQLTAPEEVPPLDLAGIDLNRSIDWRSVENGQKVTGGD